MPPGLQPSLAWYVVVLGLLVAAAFRPWQVLNHRPLQAPWLVAMLVLPWVWWMDKLLPIGLPLHLSGMCLMVLMFGWPMAVNMALPAALFSAIIDVWGPQRLTRGALHLPPPPQPDWTSAGHLLLDRLDHIAQQAAWVGVIPATIALALGLLVRRWLPHHLFVYILGRGFFVTAAAVAVTGALAWLAGKVPNGLTPQEWMLGHWLLGWGEAISTGMLVATFVAFKPHWLLTYSDVRYLPRQP